MFDSMQLDDLARRLAANMPRGLQVLQEDVNRSFRATLEAGLGRLDLVTREEFDVQAAVLARSRAKVEALEQRLRELEARLGIGAVATGAASAAGAEHAAASDAPRTP